MHRFENAGKNQLGKTQQREVEEGTPITTNDLTQRALANGARCWKSFPDTRLVVTSSFVLCVRSRVQIRSQLRLDFSTIVIQTIKS